MHQLILMSLKSQALPEKCTYLLSLPSYLYHFALSTNISYRILYISSKTGKKTFYFDSLTGHYFVTVFVICHSVSCSFLNNVMQCNFLHHSESTSTPLAYIHSVCICIRTTDKFKGMIWKKPSKIWTQTPIHPFNGPFTRVSRYQKGKTNLDFTTRVSHTHTHLTALFLDFTVSGSGISWVTCKIWTK